MRDFFCLLPAATTAGSTKCGTRDLQDGQASRPCLVISIPSTGPLSGWSLSTVRVAALKVVQLLRKAQHLPQQIDGPVRLIVFPGRHRLVERSRQVIGQTLLRREDQMLAPGDSLRGILLLKGYREQWEKCQPSKWHSGWFGPQTAPVVDCCLCLACCFS